MPETATGRGSYSQTRAILLEARASQCLALAELREAREMERQGRVPSARDVKARAKYIRTIAGEAHLREQIRAVMRAIDNYNEQCLAEGLSELRIKQLGTRG